MLEYEKQIFLDSFHEDGLLVMAKGLGIDKIFQNFLRVYCDAAQLVLVLNTSSQEEDYFMEQLERENVKPLPKVVTNEINAAERQRVYLQGGVLFITSRILVVDLLTDRVPIEHVSGILVYKSHRIVESCQEAFILRLFRQKNKTGFIKAFSDNAHSFTTGFAQVERTMKNLFVKNLFLWPRFHASVVANLEQHKVDVVEMHVQLTPAMLACQTALLDLINACIKELKRCTTAIDTEEITVENAIGKSFDQIIRLQLDPVWHQLGFKTKQLVSDLKTLRLILRTSEKQFGQNTGWLFTEASDSLFLHARERIYGMQTKTKEEKETNTRPKLEECPKWKILKDVLKEIREDNKTDDPNFEPGRVLIAAEDDRTCSQLKEVLCDGGQSLLIRLYNKSIAMKGQLIEDNAKRAKFEKASKLKSKRREKEEAADNLTLTQMVGLTSNGDTEGSKETDDTKASISSTIQQASVDAYYGIMEEPVMVLHPLHGGSDPNGLTKTLQEIQPRYVILYDADMQFVRELEVYKSSHPSMSLRVYFLMYTGSVEEQRYLTTLRKEKESFEYLIREKATMVIPEEREGKLEDDPNLSRDTTPANATVNTRQGGVSQKASLSSVKHKVIVDMREFRSELPSLIHRRGIDIEPVTLEVGDYILSPDICVERKSVSDLIGSLNNGRLYNQAVSMCRYYKKPILLIEFDSNKSFALQVNHQMSSEVSLQDVISRLSLLTLHFPQLRILWCQSPYATAEIFEELKIGRPQPDAIAAVTVGSGEESLEWSDKYSHGPQDFLLKLPGVTVKNYRIIMNKVDSLAELFKLSEEKLNEILGNSTSAKQLYDAIHMQSKTDKLEKVVDSKSRINKNDLKKGVKRKR